MAYILKILSVCKEVVIGKGKTAAISDSGPGSKLGGGITA
jgi:hypothetical protein